jgi:hypothetical protein
VVVRPMIMWNQEEDTTSKMYISFVTNMEQRMRRGQEIDSDYWFSSPYGKLNYTESTNIAWPTNNTSTPYLATFGVSCSVAVQDGHIDLKRVNETWLPISGQWINKTTRYPLFALDDLGQQLVRSKFHPSRQDLGLVVARYMPCPHETQPGFCPREIEQAELIGPVDFG